MGSPKEFLPPGLEPADSEGAAAPIKRVSKGLWRSSWNDSAVLRRRATHALAPMSGKARKSRLSGERVRYPSLSATGL